MVRCFFGARKRPSDRRRPVTTARVVGDQLQPSNVRDCAPTSHDRRSPSSDAAGDAATATTKPAFIADYELDSPPWLELSGGADHELELLAEVAALDMELAEVDEKLAEQLADSVLQHMVGTVV
eukprot:SAG31_NODE_28062_length_416_cov_0.649842_1_plen_123_part_10